MSYQRCGLADSASIPDRTTIWTLRKPDWRSGGEGSDFSVEGQLLKQGYIARGGQIIDATLLPAPKQYFTQEDKEQIKQVGMPADWKPAKRLQKDLDATWTKRHGMSHHGYKLSINVDKRYKVIRKLVTDTATTHDGQHFDTVLDLANTRRDVYADKGYPSAEREAKLKVRGCCNHIQSEGHRNPPLSECQQRRNQKISRTRARVEHVYGAIAQMGGKLIRTIGQVRANFAMTIMAAWYNLKRLTYLKRAGLEAF